ncbi:MAG TPA: prepilin-type N-terminal cleavage/methylation domain-containing protein [Candidatus Hydrogenedentes bacterium]|nr:prepilin-type N-terminal cleavage/methylation domain-containing protein [Candidatus Hydrogenedentota bacterium]HRK33096.1 prepilin-type N-terminal cleavage/methylation domain-containing protein [Candidatus Hydrogenedentota bacterium]
MNNRGFTLVELMMVVAILSIVSVLAILALQSSSSAMATAASASEVQGNVREALTAMKRELQLASKTPDDSLIPPLSAVRIVENPAVQSPVEIIFQVPRDGTGLRWSNDIRFRYVNEDVNNDGVLDSGEDVNGDGTLTRRIMRLEDVNGDGDTNDAGESRPLAGVNNLIDVDFAMNGNVITVTLQSGKHLAGRTDQEIMSTVSTDIYLQN